MGGSFCKQTQFCMNSGGEGGVHGGDSIGQLFNTTAVPRLSQELCVPRDSSKRACAVRRQCSDYRLLPMKKLVLASNVW